MRYPLALLAMPAAIVIIAETAQALSQREISQIAEPLTVHISVRTEFGSAIGSGVIIQKEGDTYYVLTSRHVIDEALEGYLFTQENFNQGYAFNPRIAKTIPGVDLAVVQFTSSRDYPLAKLGDSDQMAEGSPVFVAGFPDAQYTRNRIEYRFVDGTINTVSSNPLEDKGYAWQYSNPTLAGMSGGGVFNEEGKLVGIHGIGVREGRVVIQVNKAIPIAIYQKQNPLRDVATTSQNVATSSRNEELQGENNSSTKPIPSNAVAFLNQGYKEDILGNFQEALANFNRAIEIDPNYAKAYNNRGAIQGKLGNHEEAIADFSRAIELDPEFAEAYYGRGVELVELGSHGEAIADFNQAIELNPNDGYSYIKLASAYEAIGDKNAALTNYKEASRLHRLQGNQQPYNYAERKIKKLERELGN